MQALQNGQITPAEYELIMNSANGLLGGQQMQQSPATGYPVQADTGWQPPTMPPQRPVDPMQGQQMAPMPQAPEPTMPMMPMPSAEPSQMQMSPMPMVGNGGQDTPAERDYLEQFVNNAKRAMGGRPNVDTPAQQDYLQNIMQGYNKRYGSYK